MIPRRVALRLACFWALLGSTTLAPNQSTAHNTHLAVTEISFNERASSIEVVHRFSLHDTDHAVELFSSFQTSPFKEKEYREHFAIYVAENFSLHSLSDKEVVLTNIGSEIDGGFLWVYQEAVAPKKLKGLTVRCVQLMKLWSASNTVGPNILVNVTRNGKTHSLRFRDNDGSKSIRFE
ncbi:MAG: DUF6702 family protein [Pseudomonadota bacterium]